MTTQDAPPAVGTDTAAVAVFDSHEHAEAAVKQLAASKFDITKVTVIGRGFHTEDKVVGFFNSGDRVKFWGRYAGLWGGVWGLLLGGLFMTIPVIGPVVVVGHLAMVVMIGIDSAVIVGGLGALGAALYGIGIPKDSVLRYEKVLKEDGSLIIASGSPSEVGRAVVILESAHSTQLEVHEHVSVQAPAPVDESETRR